MASFMQLMVELGLDEKKFKTGMEAASKETSDFSEKLGGLAGMMTRSISPVAAVAVGVGAVTAAVGGAAAAVVAFTKGFLDVAGHLTDLSERTGVSTEALQKFQVAGSLVGVGVDSIAMSMQRLQRAMNTGSESVQKAFKTLGLSMKEVREMTPEQQLQTILEKLNKLPDPAQRSALAMQLLGRAGAALVPLGAGLGDVMKRAEDLGLVIDKKLIAAGDDLGDSLTLLGAVFDSFQNRIGATVASSEPLHLLISGLTDIFGMFNKIISDNESSLRSLVDNAVIVVAKGFVFLVDVVQLGVDAWDGLKLTWHSLAKLGVDLSMVLTKLAGDIAAIRGDDEMVVYYRDNMQMLEGLKKSILDEAGATVDANAKKTDAIQAVRGQMENLVKTVEAAAGKQHKYNEKLDKGGSSFKAINKEAEAYAKKLAALKEDVLGITQAKQIEMVVQAFYELQEAGKVNEDVLERLQEKLQSMGDEGAEAAIGMRQAWLQNVPVMEGTVKNMGDLVSKTGVYADLLKRIGQTPVKTVDLRDAALAEDHLKKVQEHLAGVTKKSEEWRGMLDHIRNVMDVLGLSSESFFGKFIGGATAGISAGFDFVKSFDEYKLAKGLGQKLTAAFGMLSSALTLGSAAISIGKAIGDLFSTSPAEKAAKEAGKVLGMKVSEEMGQAIVDQAKKLGISVGDAILLNLSAAMDATGKKTSAFGKEISDLMKKVAAGTIPAKEGIAELGKVFQKAAEEGGAAMVSMIKQARELGLEVPEITAHVQQALAGAVDGLRQYVAGLSALDGEFGRLGANSATMFMATFDALVREHGWVEATRALEETYGTLREKLVEIGDESALALLAPFERFAGYLENEVLAGALEATAGLTALMHGMAEAGYLDAAAFEAMQQSAFDLFNHMVEGGMESTDALRAMAPTIQEAIRASEMFGIPLDEDMQKLKEMAEQNGITFKTDPMERMIDVLERIAVVLGAELPEAAEKTFNTLNDGIDELDRKEVRIPIHYEYYQHGTPPPEGGGEEDLPHHAKGAVVWEPEVAQIGEVPEAVTPLDKLYGNYADLVASKVAAAVGGGGGMGGVNLTFNADGERIAKVVVRRQEAGYARYKRQLRS